MQKLSFCLFAAIIVMPLIAEAETTGMGKCEKLFLEERYDNVMQEADRLIEARAYKRDDIYYLKGLSELKLGKFTEARSSFDKIISRSSSGKIRFDAQLGIADSYLLAGDNANASKAYENMLDRYPDDKNISAAYFRLADAYDNMGLKGKADNFRRKARKIAPLSFEAKLRYDDKAEAVSQKDTGKTENFAVQIGYFKSKKNAERLAAKLRKDGYDGHVEMSKEPGDTFYRVKAGNSLSAKEADQLSSRLKKKGYSNKVCQ